MSDNPQRVSDLMENRTRIVRACENRLFVLDGGGLSYTPGVDWEREHLNEAIRVFQVEVPVVASAVIVVVNEHILLSDSYPPVMSDKGPLPAEELAVLFSERLAIPLVPQHSELSFVKVTEQERPHWPKVVTAFYEMSWVPFDRDDPTSLPPVDNAHWSPIDGLSFESGVDIAIIGVARRQAADQFLFSVPKLRRRLAGVPVGTALTNALDDRAGGQMGIGKTT